MKDSNTDYLICDCGNDSFYDFSVDGTATCPKCGKEVEINGKGVKTDLNKYMKDIEQALDKQVAKKVGYDPEDVMYFCPTCGGGCNYIMYDYNIKEAYNYCCNCGQKLDWGGHKHEIFQG